MNNFYKNKRVLITGHTGFKGSWLSIWLHHLGAEVIGFSLEPYSSKDNFVLSNIGNIIEKDLRGDIRNKNKIENIIKKYQPEIIFHLAAQPLVRQSYSIPLETYQTNVIGTINLLEAIRNCNCVKVAVMVTTDKCYENKEQLWGYRETDSLGGYDPYSSSKAAAEIAISSWRSSFFNPNKYYIHGKSIASVRAGNVIGGGDWSMDRIIPDCIRSLEEGTEINIRNPKAIRPWQHVLEPLSGYLILGEKMWNDPIKYSTSWNFGPNLGSVINVMSIAEKVILYYGKGEIKDISSSESFHESNILILDNSKAFFELGWHPKLDINKCIELTIDWYKEYKNVNVFNFCKEQILKFQNI